MDRPDPPPAVHGSVLVSRPAISRGLGLAGHLSLTAPLALVFVLRLLGLYDGAIRGTRRRRRDRGAPWGSGARRWGHCWGRRATARRQ